MNMDHSDQSVLIRLEGAALCLLVSVGASDATKRSSRLSESCWFLQMDPVPACNSRGTRWRVAFVKRQHMTQKLQQLQQTSLLGESSHYEGQRWSQTKAVAG